MGIATNHQPISVLIPDGEDAVNATRVLRCLRQAPGTTAHVLSTDSRSSVRFSRHCKRFHTHSSQNDDEWTDAIERVVRRWKINVVLPATLRGVRLISQRREAISRSCAIAPVAKPDMVELANNKWALHQFAKQHALPVPPSVLIPKAGDPITDSEDMDSIEYPALLKPTALRGGFGFVLVDKPSDFPGIWSDKRIMKDSEYLLQSYIPGAMLSLSVFCASGELVAYTLWKEVVPSKRQFSLPQSWEYIEDEQTVNIGRQVVAALGWDGVANINLVLDQRDQTAWILEINPRFWRSLLGSLAAGVNFPLAACLSAMGEEIPDMRQIPGVKYARTGAALHMLLSRLIGKDSMPDFRWRDSALPLILTDPLPELAYGTRAMVHRIR